MKILVTGGAGFIGSHLVDRLVQQGIAPIVVLDNLHRGRKENLTASSNHIEFWQEDIRDLSALRRAMQDVNIVFHLAAQSRVLGAVGNLEYSFSTNVQGTLNVLTTARDAGVKRVIFTSSREVYGDPDQLPVPETAVLVPKNVYGASKMAGEAYCHSFRNDGLETVVLRLANVYGTRDHDRVIPLFIENALQGRTLTINGGDQLVDFVWIGTVVDALTAAGFEPTISTPLNIGSGKGITISELASRVLEQTGARASLEYSARHPAEVVGFIADVSRARKELNLPVVDDPLDSLDSVIRSARGTSPPIKNS